MVRSGRDPDLCFCPSELGKDSPRERLELYPERCPGQRQQYTRAGMERDRMGHIGERGGCDEERGGMLRCGMGRAPKP